MKLKFGGNKRAMIMSQHRCSKGFTVMELMVVVGILAVLAMIIVPALSRSFDGAQKAKCLSNMRQLGLAVRYFIHDNDGTMVSATDRTDPNSWVVWHTLLRPYIPVQYTTSGRMVRSLYCPKLDFGKSTSSYFTGYSFNEQFDAKKIAVQFNETISPIAWEDTQVEGNTSTFGGSPSATGGGGSWYNFAFRHNNGCHVLMLDGHVETITPKGNNKANNYPDYNWDAK